MRLDDLQEEPDAEVDPRGDAHDEDERERDDPRRRIEDDERAEHRGDRPARADLRDARAVGRAEEQDDGRLAHARDEPTCDVEREVAEVPERVLDVLAEDGEEEHVAEQVIPARVHEHRGEPADAPRLGRSAAGVDRARVERRVADSAVEMGKLVEHPDGDIRGDQRDVHDREAPG